jgi:hypothetical protein
MQNQDQAKLFAFKLAEKQDKETKLQHPWKVRDGVSAAGCSGPDFYDNYRAPSTWGGADAGIYC